MNLSDHFTLAELTFSTEAARRGYDNTPGPAELHQLKRLAEYILEPLRRHLDRPIHITSGFRSFQVNAEVGGASGSHHLQGRAADIVVPGLTPLAVCEAIKGLDLPYDQLIHEFGRWCHVSIATEDAIDNPPQKDMTAVVRYGHTQYLPGLMP